jgi:hypothetical protein
MITDCGEAFPVKGTFLTVDPREDLAPEISGGDRRVSAVFPRGDAL